MIRASAALHTSSSSVDSAAYVAWDTAGGTLNHVTTLMLLPEQGVGFFASVNKQTLAPQKLLQLFVDRYYPDEAERPEPMAGAAERLERYTGWYSESRGAVTHTGRIARFTSMRPATAGENGRLQFLKKEWLETEPNRFRASLALTAAAGIVMAVWIEHWNLLLHRF